MLKAFRFVSEFCVLISNIRSPPDALCYPTRDESEDKIIVLQNEEMEPTILDCDYEVEESPKFITVKWYRDDKSIYQWIFGTPPYAIVSEPNGVVRLRY